jgi:hypothetical protein
MKSTDPSNISAKLTDQLIIIAMLAIGARGAAGCAETVHPDDMSAEAHRREAAKESTIAQRELDKANTPAPPPNFAQTPTGDPEGYYYPVNAYNPVDDHLVRAGALQEHARQHQEAAAELEGFEQAECKSFPAKTRAACPLLGPVVSIADVQGGVRVRFAKGTRVDAVLAHMRCHFAYAQAHGFDKVASCPLYIRGVAFQRGADDPQAIDITGPNSKTVTEIRKLSRSEAVVVHNDKN